MGEPGEDWLLLGSISPDGKFRLYSREHPFTPDEDWLLIHFAPEDTPPDGQLHA
jgi:CPA1 family monovalent cation:H+ antiporter